MRRFTVHVIGMQLGEGVKFSDGSIAVYWFKRLNLTEYSDMRELVMDNYIIEWVDKDPQCRVCDYNGMILTESNEVVPCPSCCNPLGRPLKEGESLS